MVRLDYDDEGRFLRPVVVEDAEPYRRCRDLALAEAMPFGEYLQAAVLDPLGLKRAELRVIADGDEPR